MNINTELLQIQELNYKLTKIKNTLRRTTEEIENKDLLIEEVEQLENTINKIKELINL